MFRPHATPSLTKHTPIHHHHQRRPFSCTCAQRARKPLTSITRLLPTDYQPADALPAYPYGPARWYKQSNKGLYGGQRIRFGNNVSRKTETKTRRTWQPNVQRHRLPSAALGRTIKVRLTTRVLRSIEKAGSLDRYLLSDSPRRIKQLGVAGWKLRWAVLLRARLKGQPRLPVGERPLWVRNCDEEVDTPEMRDRFNQLRVRYGLPTVEQKMVERTVGEDVAEESEVDFKPRPRPFVAQRRERFMSEEVDVPKPSWGQRIVGLFRRQR